MKKKLYLKPDMQVFELKKEQMLLMSSPGGVNSPGSYTYGDDPLAG